MVLENILEDYFSIYSYVKLHLSPTVTPLYPLGLSFKQSFKHTLPDDAYQQATNFLANWLKRNKIFSVYFYVKIRPPIMAPSYPQGS